jgi:hypothetical protein
MTPLLPDRHSWGCFLMACYLFRAFLWLLATATMLCPLAAPAEESDKKRPNILFIMADDSNESPTELVEFSHFPAKSPPSCGCRIHGN